MGDSAARTLRSLVRRPLLQDAALAGGLLAACLLVNDAAELVRTRADGPGEGGGWSGPGAVWVWWAATALTVAGVTLRRRHPVPMLVVCALTAGARMAVGVLPTVLDLAVLILLCTVAARCSRPVSLLALGGLLLGAAWLVGSSPVEQPLRIPSFRMCSRHTVLAGSDRVGQHAAGSQEAEADTSGSHASRPDTSGSRQLGSDQAESASAAGASAGADCRNGGANPWRGLPVLGSALVAAWAVGYGSRNRRAYLEQLHARAQDLERERDQRAALAVAAERGRISREVHDVVAHGLSLIVVQAQGAEAALDRRPADTRAALRTIVTAGRDSLADMRRVLAALGEVEDAWHSPPGLARLPSLLTRVRDAGTPVRLRVDGTPRALPSAVDLSAYRVVQEALTNVMKHAGAGASAEVVVSYGATEVAVEVSDDGPGTAAGERPAVDGDGNDVDGVNVSGADGVSGVGISGGNGLPGMHRRVTLLGGRLSAAPGDRGGFVVQAGLPIHHRNA